jgi:hypothetical protein
MVEYIINEKKVSIPESWVECTFERFLKFANLLKSIERETKEIKTDVDEWEQALQDIKDNTKILSYWCGMSESDISMLDLDVANEIMTTLSFLNESYIPINIESFTIGEEKFILPEALMTKSSFGRYIEAEQLELHANMLDKGRLDILPKQIAILCKKKGEEEKLDDDLIDKRAKLFEKLDMATIWDVGFFLNRLEQKLMISFLTSQEKGEIQKQEWPQKEQ